jgi:hypothetical protein
MFLQIFSSAADMKNIVCTEYDFINPKFSSKLIQKLIFVSVCSETCNEWIFSSGLKYLYNNVVIRGMGNYNNISNIALAFDRTHAA